MAVKKQDKIYLTRKKTPTQKSIAKKHNVSEGYISQIMNGDKPVPRRMMKDLEKLINGGK